MARNLSYVVIVLALLVSLCGCAVLLAGAAGGTGTAFWLSGKLSSEVSASYEGAIDATKIAIKSLNMDVDKETKTDDVTQIRSEYRDGREVWIDVRPLTQTASKIEIRVGIKGDKAASTKILERIKKYL